MPLQAKDKKFFLMQTQGQQMMPQLHQEQMKNIMDLVPDGAQLWNESNKWDGVRWPNREKGAKGIFGNPKQILIKSDSGTVNIIGEYFSKGKQRQRLVQYRPHDFVMVQFNFGKTTVMKGRRSVSVDQKPQIVRFEATGKTMTASGSVVPASTMTAMQELGTLWVFRQVIQENKKFRKWQDIKNDSDTYDELKKIWKEIGKVESGPEDRWLEIFFKQNDAFMDAMKDPRIKLIEEFNRGATHAGGVAYKIPGSSGASETFMEFISKHVKQYGISQKDNWNPADIWLIKNEKKWRDTLIQHSSVEGKGSPSSIAHNLQQCNAILRDAWAKHEIIGISLKAIGSGDTARWQAVNTNIEFVNARSDLNFRLTFKLKEIRCYLKIDKDGGVTQDSWVYIDNGPTQYKFQVKANSSSDRSGSGLKYEGQEEGATAARLGKATVDLLMDLMDEAGIPFDKNKTSYPMSVDELIKKEDEYRKKLATLASKGVKLSKDGTQTADKAYDALLYLMNREPWVANSRCQQITWLSQLLKLQGQKQQEFLADLVFLSKKEGKRYGPFGKIY
jgi:hypothetical protein